MKPIEINIRGIKCDNTECDFIDNTVQFEDYGSWLNKPCPKCQSNLLTQADLDAVIDMMALAEVMNSDEAMKIMEDLGKELGLEETGEIHQFGIEFDGSGYPRLWGNVMNSQCKEVEFNVGDLVTYQPYETSSQLFVIGIRHGALGNYISMSGQEDKRIFYLLSTDPKHPYSTITTGISIKESKLFIESNWKLLVDDEVVEKSLTQQQAEEALCRACNEDGDAYIYQENNGGKNQIK